MALSYSYDACNTRADALAALLDGGYLRIYDGTRRTYPDSAITTQTLLSEHRFSTPAFLAAAVDGVIEADSISSNLAAATGTPTWFAALQADGTTPVFDGSVGGAGSGADLVLSNLVGGEILQNRTVNIDSLSYTEPR